MEWKGLSLLQENFWEEHHLLDSVARETTGHVSVREGGVLPNQPVLVMIRIEVSEIRKTNLIPCVVVIVACPRCSHLKFCHLKSGSSGSTVIMVLALQMALTILTVLMVFDM